MFFDCKRKLQVTNGYTVDFRQISNLLSIICRKNKHSKEAIKRTYLIDESGLGRRWVENITSIMRAMSLIYPKSFLPTELGIFIYRNDPFFKENNTLKLIHYITASNKCNIVWYEIFNMPINVEKKIDTSYIRSLIAEKLDGFSEKSLFGHVKKEIAEIVKVYTTGKMKKIGILTGGGGHLKFHRIEELSPDIFMACLLIYSNRENRTTFEIDEILLSPCSPGKIFLLDKSNLDDLLFEISKNRFISIEKRFNLNQIRIIYDKNWLEYLKENNVINNRLTSNISNLQRELDFE